MNAVMRTYFAFRAEGWAPRHAWFYACATHHMGAGTHNPALYAHH